MLILANVLALALVVADEPAGQQPGFIGIPSRMPKIPKPGGGNPEADAIWQLSLADAIRIGLENSPVVRVIPKDGQAGISEPTPLNPKSENPRTSRGEVVIAKVNADASVWNFKSALMAHVRSVEQQYWALAMTQTNLWARETAVKLGEEILRRERAEFEKHGGGRGGRADIAEAEQQLETFKLNLVTATSDVITTERQLRNILGLAPSDNRRIVACTSPSEMEIHPDWDKCVGTMLASQPDIVQQTQALNMARVKAIFEVDNPTLPADQRDASRKALEKQREFLQQITHQTTHSLARFFLEVDANYKQFKTAQNLRETAQKKLDKQRAFYEEGRITVDRLLDAVSQYSNAIAEEALYRSTYNTSIAALDESMGTVLSADGVTIETKPRRELQDAQVAPASFDAAPPAPAVPVKVPTVPASTTYKLRAKLGLVKVLDIEFEVCPGPK